MPVVDNVSFRLEDAVPQVRSHNVYAPTGATLAEIQTWVNAYAPLLDAITGCRITAITVQRALTIPGGVKIVATPGHFAPNGANFICDIAASNYNFGLRVPGILESLLNGREVDMTEQDIIDYTAAVVTGVGAFLPSNRDGGDIVGIASGNLTFRK